ncbi:stage II sporulation protein P [Hazenella sp. IB182357]|uniref:Stage II sporulation protein P n=1 Tax=Polycladospora coralii TaxID=2771432 RepID=A0A926N9R0_9BACL|nr:stage II sporulation protein P [Polycladospora coralii]MBD1371135.1 stage II sporulation protein P [Polycladospora coralii]MBS7530077.1 stage II sporulation protein P [Polycladospora coralii]
MRKKYRGFTTVNMSGEKTRKSLVLFAFGIAILFLIVGAIFMSHAKGAMQKSDIHKVTSRISEQSLLMVMAENIPYLQEQSNGKQLEHTLSRILFEAATSINFRDPRTFLGKEMPMFALFDSEIILASEDVDFTSIPIESAPPPELEKEIQKAMEDPEQKNETEDVNNGSVEEKKVLIYTTHFWESYLPELGKKAHPNANQATDVHNNITKVSTYMAKALEKKGIGAVATQKKYSAKGSYNSSRKMVTTVMKQHEDVTYLIDLHRDSQRRAKTTKTIHGKTYAQVVFVVGKSSKNYQQNLKLAKEMHQAINQKYPGLSKAVITKASEGGKNNGEYNQSLSPNSMLVEVGGVDNTFEEAYLTADVLAEVLSARLQNATPVLGKPKKP